MSLRMRDRVSFFQRFSLMRGGILLLGVVLAFFSYHIWFAPPAEKPATLAFTAAAPEQSQEPHQGGTAEHAHTHPEEAVEALSLEPSSVAFLDASALHFSTPAMAAPELFAGGATRVILDRSCDERSTFKPDAAQTLEETLFKEFGIVANARIPEATPFEELTQFYRIGADFYQLSINALPASRPPVYELSWYRAHDAQMLTEVARLAVPPAAGMLDVTRASELFMQILSTARANRAELGARLLNVHIPGASNGANSDQELRFINGAPLQWVFGSGVCQLTSNSNQSLCRCLPDGEQLHVPDV